MNRRQEIALWIFGLARSPQCPRTKVASTATGSSRRSSRVLLLGALAFLSLRTRRSDEGAGSARVPAAVVAIVLLCAIGWGYFRARLEDLRDAGNSIHEDLTALDWRVHEVSDKASEAADRADEAATAIDAVADGVAGVADEVTRLADEVETIALRR